MREGRHFEWKGRGGKEVFQRSCAFSRLWAVLVLEKRGLDNDRIKKGMIINCFMIAEVISFFKSRKISRYISFKEGIESRKNNSEDYAFL